MPSRNRVAKTCEFASRSLKETALASIERFSDIGTPHYRPAASLAAAFESSGVAGKGLDIVAAANRHDGANA
jgi:hypothetical protein